MTSQSGSQKTLEWAGVDSRADSWVGIDSFAGANSGVDFQTEEQSQSHTHNMAMLVKGSPVDSVTTLETAGLETIAETPAARTDVNEVSTKLEISLKYQGPTLMASCAMFIMTRNCGIHDGWRPAIFADGLGLADILSTGSGSVANRL